MSEQYGEAEHRKVWETWKDLRNWTKTAELLGMSMYTIRRWKDADFRCPDACPYHDYEGLLADVRKMRAGRNQLIAEGNYSPVNAAETAIKVLEGEDAAKRMDIAAVSKNPAYQIFRKDEERVSHLELLWERTMYQLTGVPVLTRAEMEEKGITPDHYDQIHQQQGLQFRSMKDGIQGLQAIMGMLEAIKGSKVDAKVEKKSHGALEQLSLEQLMKLAGNPQILIDATDIKVK